MYWCILTEAIAMSSDTKSNRTVFITVSTHALLVVLTSLLLQSLLLSVARFADHDMDFHRHVTFRLLWALFPICGFCRQHIAIVSCLFLGGLAIDWKLCRHLVRRKDKSFLPRVSLAVVTASLISALACAYAVDEYIGYFAGRLDKADDYWETNRARLWVRHGSKNNVDFAFRDLGLDEVIALLNRQLYSEVLVVLHAPQEAADELRLSFTPNGDSPVPLRTALEVLRTRIEDTTTMQARWVASGNVIDFYCVEGDSPSAAESEEGAQRANPADLKTHRRAMRYTSGAE